MHATTGQGLFAGLAEFVNARIPSPCPIDCGAFQGAPMRHRGVHVGSFFLDAGGAATCESLRRRVWGDRGGAGPQVVRNAIRKLRRKLGDDARHPGYILGERGLGYRMPGPEDGP